MGEFLLALSVLGVVACLVFMVRNEVVCRRRGRLLARIGAACDADISAGRDPMWRFEEYQALSYEAQLFAFRDWPRDPARAER